MKEEMIVIHNENSVKFCMTTGASLECRVLVDKEVHYTHRNFDIAVKEYQIIRKEMSQK